MKTDERMKATLIQAAEAEIVQVVERLQELAEGDLMGVINADVYLRQDKIDRPPRWL